mmetsp:Transcript_107983/g.344743  ORF Transcript_107983/g.344743 Transcript_107983/m.344743 type:complete len:421 (-) Transcript_107983:122-1384(-)
MATYIVVGEADATVQGAEWLQMILLAQQGEEAQLKFTSRFKAVHTDLAHTRQYNYGPVFELFLDHSQDLFTAIPEARGEDRVKEVESFFALVLSMLLMLEEADQIDKGTTRLCEILKSSTTQQPDLRLRLLMNLYNAFTPTLEFRYRVFKYIIDYAHEANLFDQVMPYLEYLDPWMADWEIHLSVEDKRTMFRDISKYVRALGKRVESFLHLKRYHQLFQGAKASELSDKIVTECTIQLLTDAISIPSVIQFDDILSFDTVKELSKGKESGLVKLCEVFLSGTVNSLRDFQKKNEALFMQYDLSVEDAMSKIKLLTLATLAHNRSEMTLADVAKGLEESEEGVEPWVVRAISEGIIDGRIDQLNSKVLVKSSFLRKFEKDEWAFLDGKLTSWIDNLENVIKFIGEQKVLREAGPAAITTN